MTIAALKRNGMCPCPRCLIRKEDIPDAGSKADLRIRAQKRADNRPTHYDINQARKWAFQGFALEGSRVKSLIHTRSMHPIRVSPTIFSPVLSVLTTF